VLGCRDRPLGSSGAGREIKVEQEFGFCCHGTVHHQ
jgi:hypothetical protein